MTSASTDIRFSVHPSIKPEICPTCGQRVRKLNPHRMDKAKVDLLMDIATLNKKFPWVKVQRDGRLIKHHEKAMTVQCDDVHALRLTWFGLLERKARRTGLYHVTAKGLQFLQGQVAVPKHLYCKGGVVKEQSQEMVFCREVRGVILGKEYWDNYAAIQTPVSPTEGRLF